MEIRDGQDLPDPKDVGSDQLGAVLIGMAGLGAELRADLVTPVCNGLFWPHLVRAQLAPPVCCVRGQRSTWSWDVVPAVERTGGATRTWTGGASGSRYTQTPELRLAQYRRVAELGEWLTAAADSLHMWLDRETNPNDQLED